MPDTEADTEPGWWSERLERALYAGAVLLGAVLAVVAALNQPYNQNEWAQIQPYDSWDPAVVTSGTRQPPLDPLLGALVQHVVGVGQLQQRIVPLVCGVGALVMMVLLLRRMELGPHGVLAVYVMATAPVFLRYASYVRPYAMPAFLMLVCAYAGTRWLDTGRRRWLVGAVLTAFLLPLTRVPEPVAFLGSGALLLGLAAWRGWLPRPRALWLAGGLMLALVTVGALSTLRLGGQTGTRTEEELFDPSIANAVDRIPTGLAELYHFVVPLYADWFPWWPVTLLVLVLALALPDSRRVLTRGPGGSWAGSWYWLPLVLAPLAFLVAYHTVNPYPLDQRHYRIRFAYFWVPSLTVLVALASFGLTRALTSARAAGRAGAARLAGAAAGPVVALALLASQLPMTAYVLTDNDTIDVGGAAALLEREVPDDALVVYDGPARVGLWRQPFFGGSRYFSTDDPPQVLANTTKIVGGSQKVGVDGGPVHLLLIDGECVSTVACDAEAPDWDGEVPGFERVERFDRFTLYAPTEGQAGRAGVIEAMLALAEAYGPRYGVRNLAAAARLLYDDGQRARARELLDRACDDVGDLRVACREELRRIGSPSGRSS